MADFDDDDGGGGGGSPGGVLRQKLGPLPTWMYLLLITIGLLAYYLYAKHKAGASTATPAATAGQAQPGEVTGAQNVPDYVFQNTTNVTEPPESNTITVNNPPVTPGPPGPAGPPGKPGTPGKPAAPPPKSTTPPPKGQKYTTVTVTKWTPNNTPWNSTLSGIAGHYGVKGGYASLAKLNGIKNPNLIYPGQKIKVPVS